MNELEFEKAVEIMIAVVKRNAESAKELDMPNKLTFKIFLEMMSNDINLLLEAGEDNGV